MKITETLVWSALYSLKDGWLDGEGKAPDHQGLEWLGKCLDYAIPEDLPIGVVFPTPEGGVSIEWENKRFYITLEVYLPDKIGIWDELDREGEHRSRTIDLTLPFEWEWIANSLRHRLGGKNE